MADKYKPWATTVILSFLRRVEFGALRFPTSPVAVFQSFQSCTQQEANMGLGVLEGAIQRVSHHHDADLLQTGSWTMSLEQSS